MRDGVDGLIGGALDREDFVSEIGIGGDWRDGFLNEVSGLAGARPSMLFDLVGIDGVKEVARDIR